MTGTLAQMTESHRPDRERRRRRVELAAKLGALHDLEDREAPLDQLRRHACLCAAQALQVNNVAIVRPDRDGQRLLAAVGALAPRSGDGVLTPEEWNTLRSAGALIVPIPD